MKYEKYKAFVYIVNMNFIFLEAKSGNFNNKEEQNKSDISISVRIFFPKMIYI